ncbi:MAG TPA: hypothetical protein VME70_13410 [Mycobacteriales bacterium]|nr:hypothetical protein [Mycobacteriales bacterium]
MPRAAARLLIGPMLAVAALVPFLDAPAAAAQPAPQRQVVVIAVPDLQWRDLAHLPVLSRYAAGSSVGDLSVRGEPTASRCADGSLTFAAGNRADAGGATSCTLSAASRAALLAKLRNDRYGADIAALGDALKSSHVSTAAVGPGAALLLADSAGRVGLVTTDLATAIGRAEVVAVLDPELYTSDPAGRVAADARLDAALAGQLATVPPTATVLVAGTSDGPVGGPNLHVLIVHGPGWRHVELGSGSTRSRFVQLIDLAPTVLSRLGLSIPTTMIGRPVHDTSHAVPSAAAFVDANRHDLAARRLDNPLRIALGVAGMVVLALLVLAWWRRARPWSEAAIWLSRLAVGIPIASWLLQVGPWWRPGLAWYPLLLGIVLLAFAALIAAAARWSAVAAVAVVPAVTAVVLAVDELVGSPLQASSPLGNLATVAGRFHGMGNVAFAALGAAALLCAGLAGAALAERGRVRAGLLAALAIGLVTCAADAAPRWGDDFGGLLSLPICFALLLALLSGIRFTAKRVAITVVVAVVLAVLVAAADYSRPAADRTQIGIFAGEVLHGGAGRTIHRKLYSNLHSFGDVAVTGSVAVLLIVAIVFRAQCGAVLRRVPGLRAAAIAITLLAVVGTATNDSGIVIAQFAALTGLLAIVGGGVADPCWSAAPGGRPPLAPPARKLGATERGEAFPA